MGKKISVVIMIVLVFAILYVIGISFFAKPEKIEQDDSYTINETVIIEQDSSYTVNENVVE